MKLIIENWRKFLSEATDEEAEMIKGQIIIVDGGVTLTHQI